MEVPKSYFEKIIDELKESRGIKYDTELTVDDLKENIDAAIKVGMKGFVYHQNIQELEKYIENIL